MFIAENQEYVDKLLPIADRLPNLRWIVVLDATAMFGYEHPKIRHYAKLLADEPAPDLGRVSRPRGADLAPMRPPSSSIPPARPAIPKARWSPTAGISPPPPTSSSHYPTLAEKTHRTVAYLPLCHVLGRDVAVTLPLISRLVPHFGEDPEDLPTTLFEVAPTVVVHRAALSAEIRLAGADRHPQFDRRQARRRRSRACALRAAMRDGAGTAAPAWAGRSAVRAPAAPAVFVPILNKLGLDRVELMICAGAPLPPDTMTLWQMLGVNVVEMYGQTETAGGIISGQRGPFPRPGDVGTVPAGWEVKLADDGEVLVRSPDLFERYWNNDETTHAIKGDDGWLRTGDIGEWRDGALRLIDRARDFIVTSGGKTISPSFIENIVRTSPYVAEAVVFGHGRKYLTALIEIDADTVADWARSHDVPYTGFTSLGEQRRGCKTDQDARSRA